MMLQLEIEGQRTDNSSGKSKKENAQLHKYVERISGITSAIIYVLDADGYFIFVNDAVREILHFEPEDLIGKHFSTIMPTEEYERVSREFVLPTLAGAQVESSPQLFDERRSGNRKTRNLEVRLYTKDKNDTRLMAGEVSGIMSVECAYEENAAGTKPVFIGSQGLIFDITPYKNREIDELKNQRTYYEMEKKNSIGLLAEKIAHDLNNKLGSIIGCAEIIKLASSSTSVEKLQKYAETILTSSRHTFDLSNRLMAFGFRRDQITEVNLHEIVEEVIAVVKPVMGPSITMEKCFFSVKEPVLQANPERLRFVMFNIVINAFDAMMARGGTLTIETSIADKTNEYLRQHERLMLSDDYVVLSISDTGTGMQHLILDRLFEPFFTTKEIGKGIGLGLLWVRDYMKHNGGFVDVKSNAGRGTTFTLYFPLQNSFGQS